MVIILERLRILTSNIHGSRRNQITDPVSYLIKEWIENFQKKNTEPRTRSCPHDFTHPIYFPSPSPPNATTLGIWIQQMNFGRKNSIHSSYFLSSLFLYWFFHTLFFWFLYVLCPWIPLLFWDYSLLTYIFLKVVLVCCYSVWSQTPGLKCSSYLTPLSSGGHQPAPQCPAQCWAYLNRFF